MISKPSPNFDDRPHGTPADLIVLHYTGMQTGQAALSRLCDPTAKVSAHYLIEEDGRVFHLVPEQKRAWHAGVSAWAGRDNINHSSIGIELVNPGHEFGYRPFPKPQIDSLLLLLAGISARHPIPKHGYVGHSDIAPARKCDPGELFPWHTLAAAGFGLISMSDGADTMPVQQKDIGYLKEQLAVIGYSFGTETDVGLVLKAFQAHWRPSAVTGVFDKGTKNVLADLVRQLQGNGENT